MAKLLVAKSETQGIFAHTQDKIPTRKKTHGLLASHVKHQQLTSTDVSNRKKKVKKVCITEKATPFTHWGSPKLPKTVLKRDPNNTSPVARPWKKSNSSSKASAGQKWQICTKLNSSLWEIESYCSNGSQRYLPLQGQ